MYVVIGNVDRFGRITNIRVTEATNRIPDGVIVLGIGTLLEMQEAYNALVNGKELPSDSTDNEETTATN